jgi:hypothetical protein
MWSYASLQRHLSDITHDLNQLEALSPLWGHGPLQGRNAANKAYKGLFEDIRSRESRNKT